MSEGIISMAETTKTHEVEVMYVGRLGDLGLGNPEGIPSDLKDASDTEVQIFGEKLKTALETITDYTHDGCIDGRCVMCNGDQSDPEIRHRQVSGTGSLLEDASNADAAIMDTIDPTLSIGKKMVILEENMETAIGLRPSAHQGRCGGVDGAIEDNEAISNNPSVIRATETFMSVPVVAEFTKIPYSDTLGQAVVKKGSKTAVMLRDGNWHGQTYVDGVATREPAGVETLVTDEDKFHGHKEKAVVFVLSRDRSISEEELQKQGLGDVFVVTLQRSVEKAHALAGQRGFEGAQQALIANIAKHMAVADRLPSDKTPVYIIKDY